MDCAKVAEDLGKEATGRLGKRVSGYSSLVELKEVTQCIIVQPHARHNIENAVIDRIIVRVEARILDKITVEIDEVVADECGE